MTTAFTTLLNRSRAMFHQSFPQAIYNSSSLGFSTQGSKVGLVSLLSLGGLTTCLSKEQKRALADSYIQVLRHLNVDPEQISDKELRTTLLNCVQSVGAVIASSPVFYGLYHAIHPDKTAALSKIQRVTTCSLKGVSGTLSCVPATLALYGLAAITLPVMEQQLINHGSSKQDAGGLSQTLTFAVMGAPVETLVEAKGCGVEIRRMGIPVGLITTLSIIGRLYFGLAKQYETRAETNKETSLPETNIVTELLQETDGVWTSKIDELCEQIKSLGLKVAGTTLTQHVINAGMQASSKKNSQDRGLRGMYTYMKQGGIRQLTKTAIQRGLFMTAWHGLSCIKGEVPYWAQDLNSQVTEIRKKL